MRKKRSFPMSPLLAGGTLRRGALTGLLALSLNAHAWFFIFPIPGSVTGKIGDALTGAEGENCVSTETKIGDVLMSYSGNTATVKSLSGKSSACPDPNFPIRARLEFHQLFSSKAGIELPDGFKPRELTPTEQFNGSLLIAIDARNNRGVSVGAQPRHEGDDGGALARNLSVNQSRKVEEPIVANPEELTSMGDTPIASN